jgi:hypothetical protein
VDLLIVKHIGDGGEPQGEAAQSRVRWSVSLRCKMQVCIAIRVVMMTVVQPSLKRFFGKSACHSRG